MVRMPAQLYLASRSPRRAQFLEQLGLRFESLPADVPEHPAPGQAPADYALATALAKARAAAAVAPLPLPVLGADTDVAVDGEILGKPRDRDDALAMLARLSGRSHEVCSAVAVIAGAQVETALSLTRVRFGAISPAQAAAYWDSGEPADKAGAYAIQGYAARWVQSIEGSYSGVVGLPLYETCELLRRVGVAVP
jgi:septum formation protein